MFQVNIFHICTVSKGEIADARVTSGKHTHTPLLLFGLLKCKRAILQTIRREEKYLLLTSMTEPYWLKDSICHLKVAIKTGHIFYVSHCPKPFLAQPPINCKKTSAGIRFRFKANSCDIWEWGTIQGDQSHS